MSSEISADQIEIINEFLQESRDMLDHLEPTIIELGQSCQNADCWTVLGCTKTDCPHYGRDLAIPCWLHTGYVGEGDQSCIFASNEAECRACSVFAMVNGDPGTMNAIFRLFHSMKGSAGFLELDNIAQVAHHAESLLDLIRSGKVRMEPEHVNLLCKACDFSREAMDHLESHYDDKGMSGEAEAITTQLIEAVAAAQDLVRKSRDLARSAVASPAPSSTPAAAPPPQATPSPEPVPSPSPEEIPFQLIITPEMTEKFVQEADELLQNAEQGLLQWEQIPENPEIIGDLFRHIHSFKGNCGFFGFSDMEQLAHQMETVLDAAKSGQRLDPKVGENLLSLVDVLREAVVDLSEGGKGAIADLPRHINDLAALLLDTAPTADDKGVKIGDLLVEKGIVETEVVELALKAQKKPLGEILVEMGKVTPDQIAQTLEEQKTRKPPAPPPKKAPPPSNNQAQGMTQAQVKRQDIRVDLEKLDHLINLIGEMVIAENMLIHNPDLAGLELESFNRSAQQMSKIVRELQELAMMIRMVPVSGLFRRMIRLVHDLSMKFGKKVDLQLQGEETELDKTVIETITDPLVHLIRNSLDHGLEPPQERLAAGKPEKGLIRLSARHEEGEVWITLEDDGRGLNREKILAKAAANGIIEGDGSDLSDRAVANLIFMPGFSTAEKVTDVSGRGVGMDVVKQNLEKIKGKIDVQSRPGGGTCFTLRIPLTLGIIDGMMVRVGDAKCIVPTLAIREAFRPVAEAITVTPDGTELVRVRENFFAVTRLHQVLKKEPDSRELPDGILIVLEYQESRCCLFVDEILGQQQTVIKGLSDYIGNVRWASGCTILGDGEVCLILDVGALVESVESQEASAG